MLDEVRRIALQGTFVHRSSLLGREDDIRTFAKALFRTHNSPLFVGSFAGHDVHQGMARKNPCREAPARQQEPDNVGPKRRKGLHDVPSISLRR